MCLSGGKSPDMPKPPPPPPAAPAALEQAAPKKKNKATSETKKKGLSKYKTPASTTKSGTKLGSIPKRTGV